MPQALQNFHYEIGYRGPTKGRQYEEWREGICRSMCRLEVESAGDIRIDCSTEFAHVDAVTLAIASGSSARFARTRELLTDGCDDLALVRATHGRVRVFNRDVEIALAAGEICLVEMSDRCGAGLAGPGSFTTTRLPRRLLLQLAPGAEDRLARPFSGDPARTAMFQRYFTLCNDVAADLDAVGRRAAAQHLVDLAGLLLGADMGADVDAIEPRCDDARVELMKAAALGRLGDGALTIDAVARHTGVGVRQAQRLFADSGVTFTEFVLEQRLVLARRLLSDPRSRHRKIADIAFAAGFGDLSYFNRAFRKRFGATPSDLQAEAKAVQ
jgi:AraC-like DNA-binding protein